MVSIPYERLVQWLAGPISILAGWLATQLVQSVHIFGSLGITKNQIAHAIVVTVTFAVAAAVTYAAHHKWLTNLALWWEHNASTPVALEEQSSVLPDKPDSARQPDGPTDVTPDPIPASPGLSAAPGGVSGPTGE